MKLAENPLVRELARAARDAHRPLAKDDIDAVARELGAKPVEVRAGALAALRRLDGGVDRNESAGHLSRALRSMVGDGVGTRFVGQRSAGLSSPVFKGSNLRIMGETAPASSTSEVEAHLRGRLGEHFIASNLLEAVMKNRPGCDTWEFGAMSRLSDNLWVVPVRLTNFLAAGLFQTRKAEVDVRYAVVDAEGSHVSTLRSHPVPGAETSFPDTGLNSWTMRFEAGGRILATPEAP